MSQMPKTENEVHVKMRVKRLLDKHGWYWFSPPANAFGKSGIADILAVKAGMFLAIETKYGYNKPSPMQKVFLSRVAAESHFAVCLNEKMIDDFERLLAGIDIMYTDAKQGRKSTPEIIQGVDDVLRILTAIWMEKSDGAGSPKRKSTARKQ